MICIMSSYFAYTMVIYCLASIYYYVRTRGIGQPLNESLSAKQKKIKEESSRKRRNIFLEGLGISFIVMLLIKPFNSC